MSSSSTSAGRIELGRVSNVNSMWLRGKPLPCESYALTLHYFVDIRHEKFKFRIDPKPHEPTSTNCWVSSTNPPWKKLSLFFFRSFPIDIAKSATTSELPRASQEDKYNAVQICHHVIVVDPFRIFSSFAAYRVAELLLSLLFLLFRLVVRGITQDFPLWLSLLFDRHRYFWRGEL